MDALVEVAPACATVRAVQPRVISILNHSQVGLPPIAATSTGVPFLRMANSSLNAIPAPSFTDLGGCLANAA